VQEVSSYGAGSV